MPRAARLVVPGIPHHVVQRGNRRQRTFFSDADYRLYLRLLRAGCDSTGTAVWAWCLMPNHVHLILVPAAPDGLRAAPGGVHWRYAIHVNEREDWRAHPGLGGDGLTALRPMRERVDDWRAYLGLGLGEAERDAIRAAERTCRPRSQPRPRPGERRAGR